MSDGPHFRRLAEHWRELAEIGDPIQRGLRRKWAEELDRLAEAEEATPRAVPERSHRG